jgi:hypothetical protein
MLKVRVSPEAPENVKDPVDNKVPDPVIDKEAVAPEEGPIVVPPAYVFAALLVTKPEVIVNEAVVDCEIGCPKASVCPKKTMLQLFCKMTGTLINCDWVPAPTT